MGTTSDRRRKVLIILDYFYPGYKAGGPIRSVLNIIEVLKDRLELYIITSDRDWSDEGPYVDVVIAEWTLLFNNVKVLYLPPHLKNTRSLKTYIDSVAPDLIFLNSLISPFTRCVLLLLWGGKIRANVLLAPRGELNNHALKIRFYFKIPYLIILKLSQLVNKVTWVASNPKELEEFFTIWGKKVNYKVVEDIPRQDQPLWRPKPKNVGELQLVFLARIDKMKNLDFLLRRLNEVGRGRITLDLFGSIMDVAYWDVCKQIIQTNNNENLQVTFKGFLNPNEVLVKLQQYHFLVQPSLSENFGHSIFEGMLAGLPVIISNKTPWHGLSELKIGWDLPLDNLAEWTQVISDCVAMDNERYCTMSKASWYFAENYRQNDVNIEKLEKLFFN